MKIKTFTKKILLSLVLVILLVNSNALAYSNTELDMIKNDTKLEKTELDEFSIKVIDGELVNEEVNESKVFNINKTKGVKIQQIIESSNSRSLLYEVEMENNGEIWEPNSNADESDGSFIIKGDSDDYIAFVNKLSATDASGNNLKVNTEIRNNRIAQNIIPNSDDNINYPVTIEVEILSSKQKGFYDWFSSGYWINRSGEISLSLYVRNTFHLDSTLEQAWDSVKTKFRSDSRWKNEAGMFKQFRCHNSYAPWKKPWNLEPWRPNSSYLVTVAKGCNP
ncbi:MAG: DUF2599 domain-containing protein [Tissierella sp.]|uniref:DUF2599 domain-containing protein n=1 Tax=Tissierella sp. TaxID=41274 RepID=UPI003F955DE7